MSTKLYLRENSLNHKFYVSQQKKNFFSFVEEDLAVFQHA